ncbi:enoyl-CoA hydratase/carnithine racemase (plasmid) [Mycolicibacterium chubuense NBB4]|uniref:Probable enoyl-CoA hydratase EchA17 n=1 Tax=Mycolicibacterium chubuense (strain NBB4) TaxID=710421 RepID=I4BSJ4_MYCCN|nr:enoyl-CoA hydratase-related protein [Mycolicibacterium chubuense]AFM20251.1 enoyl-CoA hydratase/carnithine racemase [Mycolicibacterium chubuense NBB4]
MTEQILQSTRDGAVALLEINRPKAKNSLNDELLAAMAAELATLRRDDTVLAVVIAGVDGMFCAGADITALDEIRARALVTGDSAESFWSVLSEFPKPVIAAVEGFALGGGCELAAACDIVIAGESARLGVPEVRIGAIPGAGGTQRIIQAVGKAKAMTMLLTGDPLTADQACEAGLVAEVIADGEAVARAVAMAQRIAENSPLAVTLAKDAALHALETSLTQGLEHEKRNFYVAVHSADSREGQAAFLAKRAPRFTGK